MSHVTKVASRFLIGVAAAALSIGLASPAARAAENCLTEPGSDNPQGKHWYYRLERGTGRHCWYLRAQDDKTARADDDKAASERPAPRKTESATSRSIADAHAEIASKAGPADGGNAAAAPSVWPNPAALPTAASSSPDNSGTPTGAAQDPAPAPRWPQQTGRADPATGAQPDASVLVADAKADTATDSQDTPPAPAERETGSIQKLALVAAGALALAGLTGSAVYRLGRRRQHNEWRHERTAWQHEQNPHRPPWTDAPDLYHSDADLDDPHPTGLEADSPLAIEEPEAVGEPAEKIEDFLARLTRQLHDELEVTRPHRA